MTHCTYRDWRKSYHVSADAEKCLTQFTPFKQGGEALGKRLGGGALHWTGRLCEPATHGTVIPASALPRGQKHAGVCCTRGSIAKAAQQGQRKGVKIGGKRALLHKRVFYMLA